jgi:glycosyltransferase involved in cell wall biosynthesis
MSNVLLEAMAASRPIVATAVDGTLDLASDGNNMLLVKPDNAESLALGIATLLEKRALREKVALGARDTALAHSVTAMVERFTALYENVAGRKGPAEII